MPTITKIYAANYLGQLTANEKKSGILSGDLHEYVLSRKAMVNIYALCSSGRVKMTVNLGNRIVVNDQDIQASTKTWPVRPDDLFWSGGAVYQDRIVIDIRDYSGAAQNVYILIDVIPM